MPNILTTRVQSFLIDDVDFSQEAASATVRSALSDFRPMGAAAPEREYSIEVQAGQDLTAASLWNIAWTQANEQVVVMMKPYGNDDAPTTLKPWAYVIATVAEPEGDLIGGAPETTTTKKRTFTMVWPCDRPVVIYDPEDVPA